MGLAEFPNFDAAMRLRLAAATDALAQEFEGIYDRQTIGALVEESAETLSSRGITPSSTSSRSGLHGSACVRRLRVKAAW